MRSKKRAVGKPRQGVIKRHVFETLFSYLTFGDISNDELSCRLLPENEGNPRNLYINPCRRSGLISFHPRHLLTVFFQPFQPFKDGLTAVGTEEIEEGFASSGPGA